MRVVKVKIQIFQLFLHKLLHNFFNKKEILYLLAIYSTAPMPQHEITWRNIKGEHKAYWGNWFFPNCKYNVDKSNLFLCLITISQQSKSFLIQILSLNWSEVSFNTSNGIRVIKKLFTGWWFIIPQAPGAPPPPPFPPLLQKGNRAVSVSVTGQS